MYLIQSSNWTLTRMIKIYKIFSAFILNSTLHIEQKNKNHGVYPLNTSQKMTDNFLTLLKTHQFSGHFPDLLAKFLKFLTIHNTPDTPAKVATLRKNCTGVHLHTSVAMHEQFSLGRPGGQTIKASDSEALFSVILCFKFVSSQESWRLGW